MVNHESDSDYSPSEGDESSDGGGKPLSARKAAAMKASGEDIDDPDTFDEEDDDLDDDDESSDEGRYTGPAMLVVSVEHQGKQHTVSKDDKITYFYKKQDGALGPLNFEDDEIINIQHEDKVMHLKKSVVDEYRKKTKYWGPLKASVERCKVMRDGVEKEVLRTKLNQIKFTAKDKSGNWLTGEGLRNAMAKTPGVIPPCDPLSEVQAAETLTINLDKDMAIDVKKKAIDEFKKLTGVEGPLKTQVKKIVQKRDGAEIAITKLFLSSTNKTPMKKTPKMSAQSIDGRKSFSAMRNSTPAKRGRAPKSMTQSFRQSEPPAKRFAMDKGYSFSPMFDKPKSSMLAYAPSAFTQPKTLLGAKFLQEVCSKTYEVESPLGAFGCYKGRTTKNTPEDQDNSNNFIPNDQDLDVLLVDSTPENMRQILPAEQLWIYLTDCAQADGYLLEFVYAIDQDRWLEVKRSSEMFQINGEVWPDLTLKVVLRENTVTYFLRVLGRLIKTGNLTNGLDVKNLLRCMASNRRICVGLSMDPYLEVLDKNDQLRTCLKDSTQITMSPYMSVRSRHCQGIVRAPNESPNGTFNRGGVNIIGSEVVCQVCIGLGRKLAIVAQDTDDVPKRDPTDLLESSAVKTALPIKKPSHIPVQKFLKNSKLKELFTETLDDILGIGPKKLINNQSKNSAVKRTFNNDDDSKPSIVATEAEFMKMMILQTTVSNGQRKLQKMCHLCKYKPSSILNLFEHMQSHLGELKETCIVCNLKLSSKQALASHMKISHTEKAPICTICDIDFSDKEQLFDHMNKHRKQKPFSCCYCDHKLATMDALKKHLKSSHDIKSIKELNNVCKTCNVYFYTKDHLLIHRINQNHDDIDPLTCNCCSFSCNSSVQLRNHIWGHTHDQRESGNMVICETCFRVFFSNFRLQYHIDAKHAGAKIQSKVDIEIPVAKENDIPYQQYSKLDEVIMCEKCNRQFKSIDTLEKHRLICPVALKENSHVVQSPMKQQVSQPQTTQAAPIVSQSPGLTETCNLCGRKFPSQRLLSSHMKIHTGNRPVFQCEECGQIYGKKQQVLDHIKMDHAEQVQQHQQQQLQIQVPQQVVQIMQQVDTLPQQQIETLQHDQVGTLQQSQHQVVEGTSTATWAPLKSPMKMTTVDQEAVYSLMQMPDF